MKNICARTGLVGLALAAVVACGGSRSKYTYEPQPSSCGVIREYELPTAPPKKAAKEKPKAGKVVVAQCEGTEPEPSGESHAKAESEHDE